MFLKLHSLSVVPRNTSLFRRSHTYLYTFARFFWGGFRFLWRFRFARCGRGAEGTRSQQTIAKD